MKYLLTLILTLFLSVGYAQVETSSFVEDKLILSDQQQDIINRTDGRDTVQAIVAYVGSGELSPTFIFYDDRVRVVFTLEQAQKIKNVFRLYEIAKEALKEYGVRDNIEIGFVERLENEILFLGTRIENLEQERDEKNKTIASLIEAESKYLEAIEKGEVETSLKDDAIKELKNDLDKAKLQLKLVVIGAAVLIVLIVLVAL